MIYELNQAALNCHLLLQRVLFNTKWKKKQRGNKTLFAFQRKTFIYLSFWACYATLSYTSISNTVWHNKNNLWTICSLVFAPKPQNEHNGAVPHLNKVANNFVWSFFFSRHCFEVISCLKRRRIHLATEIFASGLSVNSTRVITFLFLFLLTQASKKKKSVNSTSSGNWPFVMSQRAKRTS